jgi:hypothetical protein
VPLIGGRVLLACCLLYLAVVVAAAPKREAIFTLAMGGADGAFMLSAAVLGQSLVDAGSRLRRVALVPAGTADADLSQLRILWEVVVLDPIYCNGIARPGAGAFQGNSPAVECTKLALWRMTDYDRILFLDSDSVVLRPMDILLGSDSRALLAAPSATHPDRFDSRMMVLSPDIGVYEKMMALLRQGVVGTADKMINDHICPQWAASDGRLPWIYSVPAHQFNDYTRNRLLNNKELPVAVHLSSVKPWICCLANYNLPQWVALHTPEYQANMLGAENIILIWQKYFFKAGFQQHGNQICLNKAAIEDHLYSSYEALGHALSQPLVGGLGRTVDETGR